MYNFISKYVKNGTKFCWKHASDRIPVRTVIIEPFFNNIETLVNLIFDFNHSLFSTHNPSSHK